MRQAILNLTIVSLVPMMAMAQKPMAVGQEYQVNTYTTQNQSHPGVFSMGAEGFVVVWDSDGSSTSDASYLSVQGQRLTVDGLPLGGEFQVNSYTLGNQNLPTVGSDGSGGFIVVWNSAGSAGSDSSGNSVLGQRFSSDGSEVGLEFQINTYTTNDQFFPAVGLDGSGGFIVAWTSRGSLGSDSSGTSIQGQRYGSNGSMVGGEFQINSQTSGAQSDPTIGSDGAGGFVVAWVGDSSSQYPTQAQRFGSDGLAIGGEFQVNTIPVGYQQRPQVTPKSAGGFVVVWESYLSAGSDTSGYSIQGRWYNSDGSASGSQFQINTYTTAWQRYPSVVTYDDSSFLVVWQSDGSFGDFESLKGQQFDGDGLPIGGEFFVRGGGNSTNTPVALSPTPDGGFIMARDSNNSSGTDVVGKSIQGQRYMAPIFSNGFESGDISLWSASQP